MELLRLFDIPLYQSLQYPQKEAMVMRSGIECQPYSSEDCFMEMKKVSAGALNKGLERGDKVAIIAKYSNPKWTFLDIGLQQVGVIPVPISPRYDDETLSFILQDTDIKIVLVDGRGLYTRLVELQKNIRHIQQIYTFEPLPDIPNWNDFTDTPTASHEERYLAYKAAIHEDDIATIAYTADTLGLPKGVILTHKNIMTSVHALLEAMPFMASHTVVSILPQHHIFERIAIYTYLAAGCSIHYIRPSKTLLEDIRAARPHYFTAIPETLKTIYGYFIEEVLEKPKAVQSRFFKAIVLGRRFKDYGKISLLYHLKLKGADLQVFQQWKKKLGGRIEGIILGATSMPPSQARLFTAAGIDIREGYGLTETAAIVSINRFEYAEVNFGTVGKPLKGIEIKIDEDESGVGEIYVKGNNVMTGYWKNETMTQEVLQDGWLKTGDIGRFTLKKAFLQIIGRTSDTFCLSDGTVIHPNSIEIQVLDSLYVSQCMVCGIEQPTVTALVVPFFPHVKIYASLNGIAFDSEEELLYHPKIKQLFHDEIAAINQSLEERKQIAKFHLLQEPWTFQTGELSSVAKKRRMVIQKKYDAIIRQL